MYPFPWIFLVWNRDNIFSSSLCSHVTGKNLKNPATNPLKYVPDSLTLNEILKNPPQIPSLFFLS